MLGIVLYVIPMAVYLYLSFKNRYIDKNTYLYLMNYYDKPFDYAVFQRIEKQSGQKCCKQSEDFLDIVEKGTNSEIIKLTNIKIEGQEENMKQTVEFVVYLKDRMKEAEFGLLMREKMFTSTEIKNFFMDCKYSKVSYNKAKEKHAKTVVEFVPSYSTEEIQSRCDKFETEVNKKGKFAILTYDRDSRIGQFLEGCSRVTQPDVVRCYRVIEEG